MPKKLFMMGRPEVFAGKAQLETNTIFYGESAQTFADLISKYVVPGGPYAMADFGSAGGELCANILKKLPAYSFVVDAFDVDSKALATNKIARHCYDSELSHVPVPDKSYDVTIMRYVLQWNLLEQQKEIINEIKRVTKGIAIIQHCGPDDAHKDTWRTSSERMINGSGIQRMMRSDYYYSSPDEVETIFKLLNINYTRITSRRIEGYPNIFIERYALNDEESMRVRDAVGENNYIIQTTWVLNLNTQSPVVS